MQKNFKKLTLAFIVTSIFSIWIYYLVGLYDKSGTTMLWVETNIQYLIFLYVSIITSLTLYSNEDKKSKFILASIILVNFLYIIFSFWVSNVWLNNTQWLFLIWFLILALISNYIKNRFWYVITALSLLWVVSTILLAIIPLYETWPDIVWFENQFSTKIITYSKIGINSSKASIQIDKKEYKFWNGLSSYDLKINNSWSQILFKSNKKYLNTFWYILFPNKEIIQLYPQSAININKINNNYQLEIIVWNIKHKTNTWQQNNGIFSFTGKLLSYGVMNDNNIKQITDFYNNELKKHILNQIWWNISENNIITNISKTILEILSTILPEQYKDNLQNFYDFQSYMGIVWSTQKIIKFDSDKINKSILKEISDSLETTQIIK